MAGSRVAAFLDSLRELQLLEPGKLEEVARWPQARGDDTTPLARELVQRNFLTAYQINQLVRGLGKELVIGPYRLLDRLGEGGMGQVFKAYHGPMGRVVALKMLRKDKMSKPDSLRRFQQEIQVAAQLVHPNIVLAFDAGQVGNNHYIAMEYVEGIDLHKLVKLNGPVSVMQACDFVRQAALGLQQAHDRGLVHRDIKPGNLLMGKQPMDVVAGGSAEDGTLTMKRVSRSVIKILDLGLARLNTGEERSENQLTRLGLVIGTPEFLAPEQVRNSHTVDHRADLYSLGCTFFFLLTGQVPFPGKTSVEVLLKQKNEEPPLLTRHRSDVPPQVQTIVSKLLAKRPEDRFQTCADLIEALSFFERRKRPKPGPPTPTPLPVAPLVSPGLLPVAELAPIPYTPPTPGNGQVRTSSPRIRRPTLPVPSAPPAPADSTRRVLMVMAVLGLIVGALLAALLIFAAQRARAAMSSQAMENKPRAMLLPMAGARLDAVSQGDTTRLLRPVR